MAVGGRRGGHPLGKRRQARVSVDVQRQRRSRGGAATEGCRCWDAGRLGGGEAFVGRQGRELAQPAGISHRWGCLPPRGRWAQAPAHAGASASRWRRRSSVVGGAAAGGVALPAWGRRAAALAPVVGAALAAAVVGAALAARGAGVAAPAVVVAIVAAAGRGGGSWRQEPGQLAGGCAWLARRTRIRAAAGSRLRLPTPHCTSHQPARSPAAVVVAPAVVVAATAAATAGGVVGALARKVAHLRRGARGGGSAYVRGQTDCSELLICKVSASQPSSSATPTLHPAFRNPAPSP